MCSDSFQPLKGCCSSGAGRTLALPFRFRRCWTTASRSPASSGHDLASRPGQVWHAAGHPHGDKRQIGEISSGDGGRWLAEPCGRCTGWGAPARLRSLAPWNELVATRWKKDACRRTGVSRPVSSPSRPAPQAVGGRKLRAARASAASAPTVGPVPEAACACAPSKGRPVRPRPCRL